MKAAFCHAWHVLSITPARDTWHKADFDKLRENPEAIKLKREEWILGHDAEAHAYKVWPEIVASLHS